MMDNPLLDSTAKMEDNQRHIKPFQPKDENFPQNEVTTSRYTPITFLPKCLFEQFRRLANVYFVVLGIIALVGTYTNAYETAVEPASLLAPVIIVVMISVVKEGVEDFKRHQADGKVNARPVRVLQSDGRIVTVQWRDLLVGSVVFLECDEEVPADIAVLACGGVQGETAYVETAAIDGETNLKIKLPCLVRDIETMKKNGEGHAEGASVYENSITLSDDKQHVAGIEPLCIQLSAEAPNSSINHFDGYTEFNDSHRRSQRSTMNEKNLLLRGSVLRATGWCVGLVVYTGRETKLSLNSRSPPSKLSTVDRVVNRALAIAIGTMVVVCVISMFFRYVHRS